MSYEGYTQYLCPSGHYWCEDVYEGYFNDPDFNSETGDRPFCPECKAKPAWQNGVDTTNGSWDDNGERIDGYVELQEKTPAQFETCAHCQHSKQIVPPTYHKPFDGSGKVLQPETAADMIKQELAKRNGD